ncbi:TOBE domain-containing protein [Sulfurimonas sp. HSL3-2]|uniref:TOBE domain-containing protein n=1 Tax=Hydrocurvibacter mobilis TaxID=3131936 RepID=UPI0031F9A8F1
MNIINATITDIKKYEEISAVSFNANGVEISMVALELDPELKIGTKVQLKAKATNIALAKGFNSQISIANQLEAVVEDVVNGEILCSVKLSVKETVIESIITQKSAVSMDIKTGDRLIALIKSNDISIASFESEF